MHLICMVVSEIKSIAYNQSPLSDVTALVVLQQTGEFIDKRFFYSPALGNTISEGCELVAVFGTKNFSPVLIWAVLRMEHPER
jgi:hypothetical protein